MSPVDSSKMIIRSSAIQSKELIMDTVTLDMPATTRDGLRVPVMAS